MRANQKAVGRRQKWAVAVLLVTSAVVGGVFFFGDQGSETSEGEKAVGENQEKQRKKKITYSIQVSPPDATITLTQGQLELVSEQQAHNGTLDLSLEPGPYRVLVRAEGFRTLQQDIEVSPSQIAWSARLSEHKTVLAVMSNPGVSVSAAGADDKTIPPNGPVVKQSPALVAESAGPVPGDPWALPDLDAVFAYVAPGSFQMGSNDGDDDEMPVHMVKISQGYWIGEHEVTQQQYQSIVGDNPSKFKGTSNPVEKVSWNDSVSFCKKLTDQERQAGRLPEGYEYRLPTEAEWEYAARGGSGSRSTKYAGSNSIDDIAWCVDNSGKQTHPVCQKQANELGLYDMTGNVWEWCQDWAGEYSSGSQTDPVGPDLGLRRIIRGGSWDYQAAVCRITNRHFYTPASRFTIIGFRVALAPSVQQ